MPIALWEKLGRKRSTPLDIVPALKGLTNVVNETKQKHKMSGVQQNTMYTERYTSSTGS